MFDLMRDVMAACVVLGLVGGIGCGSDPPDTLTCEWLAAEDNCWKTTVRAAVSCLPPEADSGALSADNATCTYPGGHVISFNPPADLAGDDSPIGSFTVTSPAGGTCVAYQELGDNGFSLTVSGTQTFRETTSGFALDVTCPDGTSYHNGNAFNLLDCPGSFLVLPGTGTGWTDTFVSGSFVGVEPSIPVFDCRAATAAR
jgi:hypothetical protein